MYVTEISWLVVDMNVWTLKIPFHNNLVQYLVFLYRDKFKLYWIYPYINVWPFEIFCYKSLVKYLVQYILFYNSLVQYLVLYIELLHIMHPCMNVWR